MAARWKSLSWMVKSFYSLNRTLSLYHSQNSSLVRYNYNDLYTQLKRNYKYILDEKLAAKIAKRLEPLRDESIVVTNPGTAVLVKALLKAGASHVIGLEPERKFHLSLTDLKSELPEGERFEILHGDFSKIDPHLMKKDVCIPPAISSEDVLRSVKPQPWESDHLAARFIGIEAAVNPDVVHRNLLRHLGAIAAKNGIFHKGRSELAFFFAEDRAHKITAQFGSKYYNRQSIMLEMFCDVNILLREPCSMFYPVQRKEKDSFLTLVSIIPKKKPSVDIAREDLEYLNYFIRLLLVKPKSKVLDVMETISPGSHTIFDELEFADDLTVRDLCTEQISQLASAFFHWRGRSLNFFYDVGSHEVRTK